MSAHRRWSRTIAASILFLLAATTASADARTPTISGNGWVALLIILGAVAIIYFLIIGALSIETRDARLGRSRSKQDDGWFGIFPTSDPDEEDAPDFQHHSGDSGDGGDGGN